MFKSAMPTDTFSEVSHRRAAEFESGVQWKHTFECLWAWTVFKVPGHLGSECRKKKGG